MSVVRFLSTSDAARVLGLTPAAVRLIVKRGELAATGMTEGGIHLFQRADVEALAHRREAKAKASRANGHGN
jgi:excisionase family DNA binding protein